MYFLRARRNIFSEGTRELSSSAYVQGIYCLPQNGAISWQFLPLLVYMQIRLDNKHVIKN